MHSPICRRKLGNAFSKLDYLEELDGLDELETLEPLGPLELLEKLESLASLTTNYLSRATLAVASKKGSATL